MRYFETGRFRFCEIRLASGSEKPEDRRGVVEPTLRRSEGMAANIAQNGVGRRDGEQALRYMSASIVSSPSREISQNYFF